MTDLVVQRKEGLYCPPGDFYIDPWAPVAKAVVTHAHSDHAAFGLVSVNLSMAMTDAVYS